MTATRYFTSDLVNQVDKLAASNASAVAAYFEHSRLTYKELSQASRCMASDLARRQVKAGDVVGVCVGPGCDLLVAIVAIWRLGAVYMPLNPDHPTKYRDDMLQVAAPKAIVVTAELVTLLQPGGVPLCVVGQQPSGHLEAVAPVERSGEDPAYLMFTSGTTGRPKGVLLANHSLDHFIGEAHRMIAGRADDVFCNVARCTFSISLFDLLVPMTFGAAVRFVRRERVLDFAGLIEELKQSTTLHAGPALLSSLHRYLSATKALDALAHMRHVSTGGDIVHPFVMEAMQQIFPKAELFVFYGCTEVACMGTYFKFQVASDGKCGQSNPGVAKILDKTYVGQAFPGAQVTLLDEELRPVKNSTSDDAVGEIAFSGPGLALGYLNRPDETVARFVHVELALDDGRSSSATRIYRTGDYGRWSDNGQLEFLGRRDFQVQVRGARVEAAGIENQIVELGLTGQCVVVMRDAGLGRRANDQVLMAFMLAPRDPTLRRDPAEIIKILSKHLPTEMIPAHFCYLDKMPTNFNGKLDRKQLQSMELPRAEASTLAADAEAMSAEEKLIAKVMMEELRTTSIGRHEHFFAIGGHSLMAVLILARLAQEHQVELTTADFFENPTIAGLVGAFKRRQREGGAVAKSSGPACVPVRLTKVDATKPNIFLLAGAHIYSNLARELEPQWTAYGLVSDKEVLPFAQVNGNWSFSVEELADDYLQAMVKVQPTGPYYILGHSFGGVIAYQLAQMLRNRGEAVGQLILIDALLPEWSRSWRFRLMQLLRVFRTPPSELLSFLRRQSPGGSWWRFILAKLRVMPTAKTEILDSTIVTAYSGTLKVMDEARVRMKREAAIAYYKKMRPGYPNALLFLSRKRFLEYPLHGRKLTWDRYVRRLRVIWVPVGHSEMVQDPGAVASIKRALDEVLAGQVR